jgi:hypothetical protein
VNFLAALSVSPLSARSNPGSATRGIIDSGGTAIWVDARLLYGGQWGASQPRLWIVFVGKGEFTVYCGTVESSRPSKQWKAMPGAMSTRRG